MAQFKTQEQIRSELGCAIEVNEIFTIQNVKIIWPNFAGRADKYNSEGDRNFTLHVTKEQADQLAAVGWNVKCKYPRPEEDTSEQEERCVFKITVKYRTRDGEPKKNPPVIKMIGNRTRNRTLLGETNVENLDGATIAEADISFVPYFWDTATGIGVSAYLRKLYVVIQEDELDEKWAELDEEES